MALPLGRFFVLIDLINEREAERIREAYTQSAFIAWLTAQDAWNTMYQQSMIQAHSEKHGKAIQDHHKTWIKGYPGFNDYLRKLGIVRDKPDGSPNANRKHTRQ